MVFLSRLAAEARSLDSKTIITFDDGVSADRDSRPEKTHRTPSVSRDERLHLRVTYTVAPEAMLPMLIPCPPKTSQLT